MKHFLPSARPRTLRIAAAVLFLALVQVIPAWSTLSQYIFESTTGSAIDMSGATTILGPSNDDVGSGVYSIGFTFNLDGTDYTSFSVTSNGYMGLGSSAITPYDYYVSLTSGQYGTQSYPAIASYRSDQYTAGNGGVFYQVSGVAPNRILTVEWRTNPCCSSNNYGTQHQTRLYEGSNNIEFWYGSTNVSGGWIGIAASASNFTGVVNGTQSTISNSTGFPASGTVYRFLGCATAITGSVAQGGTAQMNTGDVLLTNDSAIVGTFNTRQPFSLSQTGPACGTNGGTATYAIGGVNASDYSINPTSGSVPSTPTITFTPSGPGIRTAQLTVSAGSVVRVYTLAAFGIQRIVLSGNVAQGGTSPLVNGDTLLRNMFVPGGQCQGYTPVRLTNVSTSSANYTASVTGGDYTMPPMSGTITAGQVIDLPITFCPTDTGRRNGILTVTADGVTTSYRLWAFGAYRKALFSVNGIAVDSTGELFNMQFGCVGEEFVTLPFDVSAAGGQAITLFDIRAYEVDTTVRQGSPAYMLLHDQFGNLIPIHDYILTSTPPSLPYNAAAALPLPYTVPSGTTRLYLSFIANRPAKRFGRVYLQTDAINMVTTDEFGAQAQGLLRFDVYGRGRAAMLSDAGTQTQRPLPVDFGTVRLGDTVQRWVQVANRGECPMTIDLDYLRVDVGDVGEIKFEAISPTFAFSADSSMLMLAPGAADSVLLSFAPKQIGTRRAGLYLRTNDSALQTLGTLEHGVYRIDLTGTGASGLYLTMEGSDLGMGLIGDATGPYAHGVVRMSNNSGAPISISTLTFIGADSMDFQAGAPAWPGLPMDIAPGQTIELGVDFKPMAGQPGIRQATLMATTSTGQKVSATVTATAGQRMLTVNPTAIAFPTAKTGRVVRKAVMVQNTGTMPVTITSVAISGPDSADFQVVPMARMALAPNQAEFVEVSFTRATAGSSVGSLDIMSNASTALTQIPLNATAVVNRYRDDDPSGATIGEGTSDQPNNGGIEFGVAGVNVEQGARVQITPNPVHGDEVEINYTLRDAQRIVVLDGAGREVTSTPVAASNGSVRISMAGLAGGVYTVQVRSLTGVLVHRLVLIP